MPADPSKLGLYAGHVVGEQLGASGGLGPRGRLRSQEYRPYDEYNEQDGQKFHAI